MKQANSGPLLELRESSVVSPSVLDYVFVISDCLVNVSHPNGNKVVSFVLSERFVNDARPA